MERAFQASKRLYDALDGVQNEWGNAGQPPQLAAYAGSLQEKMSSATLDEIVRLGGVPAVASTQSSVREAADLMRENHTTAVLVMDGEDISGIFTSKDIVLRVIAAGLDPSNTRVLRVMTPHPDVAESSMTIQSALRKMHGM